MHEQGVPDAAVALMDRKSVIVQRFRTPLASLLASTDELDVSSAERKWRLERARLSVAGGGLVPPILVRTSRHGFPLSAVRLVY